MAAKTTGKSTRAKGSGKVTLGAASPAAFARDLELEAVAESCSRFLLGHGPRPTAEMIAMIPPETKRDYYGNGGVVAELEGEVASLLGKEAALFLVTGTMAQQATLRIHADRRSSRSVAFHPCCHLDSHEERGYQQLHGLSGTPVGPRQAALTLDSLQTVREALAALLLELPQRDLGGTLPSWDELVAQVGWARDRGAAVHLDGARLWEASAFYAKAHKKTIADVAGLFDTVYVSFYKGLGGIAGCCVAGDRDVIDELSVWRVRHGGRVFAMWPYAASALTALRDRLPRMPQYYKHAGAIAKELQTLDGVQVLPYPVQSPMMHLRARIEPSELRARAIEIAKSDGIMSFPRAYAAEGAGLQRFEFSVGDATLQLSPTEIRSVLERLLGGQSSRDSRD